MIWEIPRANVQKMTRTQLRNFFTTVILYYRVVLEIKSEDFEKYLGI